jgi:hypothetical protein
VRGLDPISIKPNLRSTQLGFGFEKVLEIEINGVDEFEVSLWRETKPWEKMDRNRERETMVGKIYKNKSMVM